MNEVFVHPCISLFTWLAGYSGITKDKEIVVWEVNHWKAPLITLRFLKTKSSCINVFHPQSRKLIRDNRNHNATTSTTSMMWLVEWGKIIVLHVRHAFWCSFLTFLRFWRQQELAAVNLSFSGFIEKSIQGKVPRTFQARKASCQTAIRLFCYLLSCFSCKKNQKDCEVWWLRTSALRGHKGNCSTRNRPGKIWDSWEIGPWLLSASLWPFSLT